MAYRPQQGSTTARCCVVALNDRRVRIEVGYGLEGALPDATANRIIQQDIVPQFKRGDYYGGINTGVDRIMRVIEGEPLPAPEISPPAPDVPGPVHAAAVPVHLRAGRRLDLPAHVRPRRRRAGDRRRRRLPDLAADQHPRHLGRSPASSRSSSPCSAAWAAGRAAAAAAGTAVVTAAAGVIPAASAAVSAVAGFGGGGFGGGGGGFGGGGASGGW